MKANQWWLDIEEQLLSSKTGNCSRAPLNRYVCVCVYVYLSLSLYIYIFLLYKYKRKHGSQVWPSFLLTADVFFSWGPFHAVSLCHYLACSPSIMVWWLHPRLSSFLHKLSGSSQQMFDLAAGRVFPPFREWLKRHRCFSRKGETVFISLSDFIHVDGGSSWGWKSLSLLFLLLLLLLFCLLFLLLLACFFFF